MIAMPNEPVPALQEPGPCEQIPAAGRDRASLLAELRALKTADVRWREGRVFSLVYDGGAEHEELLKEAHALFFSDNALNPMAFKSLWRMEREVVKMTASLFHGPATACGTMSSGGTESILLAVKAARDRAGKNKPWIRHPEIVLPTSAHPAFHKACDTYGVTPRFASLREDFKVDVRAVRKLIGRNTVLLVGSAPQYAHGVIDPITELGALARERGLPLHVDACIGGFALPFVEKLGRPVPAWDFRVEGVTSISADVHKYGYGAKGASVIVYRDLDHLQHQFFASTDWCGGVYASPTMLGTRAGGPIAAAWVALQALGERGYLELIERALEAKDRLLEGIARIEGIEVVGAPQSTLVTYASRDPRVDMFVVADLLEARGWSVDRQQKPPSIHLTLMAQHQPIVDGYLRDLEDAVREARRTPERRTQGQAAMYGLMAKVPARGLVREGVLRALGEMYGPNGKLPDDRGVEALGGPRLAKAVGPLLAVLDLVERARARLQRRT